MLWEGWLTLAVILAALIAMATHKASPLAALFVALTTLMTTAALTGTSRVLTPTEAASGFGNVGLITVGLLFVVASGLTRTGTIQWLIQPLLGQAKGLASAQIRLLTPVAGLSAFLNNTPIVAVFLPAIDDLARRLKVPASRLYLPLSYAAILGGTCTLIGTSTNLIVNELLLARDGPGLALFDLAWVGVPALLLGLAYIVLTSKLLLPDRAEARREQLNPKRYTVEVEVEEEGVLVDQTVEEAGLRHLPGLFLAEIERRGRVIPAVGPNERLQGGDRLVLVGILDSVVDLHQMRGLRPATSAVENLEAAATDRCLVEAVVAETCPLVGRSIRVGRFRERYQAAVIAVSRGSRQLQGKIGDIVLRPGDTLLVETHPAFIDQHRDSRDFYLVSGVSDSSAVRHEKARIALPIMALMVILAASPWLTMFNAALLAVIALITTRCVNMSEALRAIRWDVLLIIGAAIGLGQALSNSGAAEVIGQQVLTLTADQPLLTLLAIYLLTSVTTEAVTNNAAAVLIFPIAMAAAEALGVSPMPFVVAIMVAASAAFATPIGYQTNLMVMGPGGYRFLDYVRFGLPLNLLVMATAMMIIPRIWPL